MMSEELCAVISKLHNSGPEETLEALNFILSLICQRKDLTSAAGRIIKLLAIHNMLVKKVVHSYLVRYSDDILNVNMLAANSLLNNISDPNPHLRRLAIKTICRISELSEQSFQLLPEALVDTSISVKKAAVLCCPIILKPECSKSIPFIDLLYEMIKDSDASLITSCVLSLNEILNHQGGIVINFKMMDYIINKLSIFDEWSISPVCRILNKYESESDEEIVSFLNSLDDKLCDRNPVVFIPAMELSRSFVQTKLCGLEKEIVQQVSVFLKLLITSSNGETTYAVLEVIETMIPLHKEIFSVEYKKIMCRFCDSPCVKVKKLIILATIINEINCFEICEELLSHCLEECPEVRKQAVTSIFTILKSPFPIQSPCLQTLVNFIDLNYYDLVDEIINSYALSDLPEMREIKENFLIVLAEQYSKITTKSSKIALLWLIGNYSQLIEQGPYILENVFNDVKHEEDENIVSALLSTSVKLFFSHPAEMQLLLGQIFQSAMCHSSPLIRRQARFYIRLLRLNVNTACKVICVNI